MPNDISLEPIDKETIDTIATLSTAIRILASAPHGTTRTEIATLMEKHYLGAEATTALIELMFMAGALIELGGRIRAQWPEEIDY